MTMQPTQLAAGVRAPAAAGLWRREIIETIGLALPIALTQLGQIAMMTSDLALVGRLGGRAVAASALAQIVLFAVFVLGMGLVSAVAPLAAQAYGAREPRMVRRALRVGLWVSTIIGIPLTVLQLQGEPILLALGQDPVTSQLAGQYLGGLAFCLMPGWWFIALRGFMGAVNRPEPALWITLAAIPANFALAYALIFGAFGLPRLDLLGAGVATALVNLGMCVACVWVCYRQRPFRKYRVLGRFWRADWALMRKLIAVGLPMSGSFLLEYGLFASAAIMVGWIGTVELAAHQIALQTAAIAFMVPFGISMAATVRVGHAVGRVDAAGTRRAGFAAIALGAAFMAAMVVLIVALRHLIPWVFLGDGDAAADATVQLAAMLLLIGATFFIADGIQTVSAGALRGLNDTRVPMLFALLSFWVVGFTACYGLAFHAGFGVIGIWTGFTIGLVLYAILLVWRFARLTQQGYMPAAPHAT
ncbi:MAG: MATE family efflux transporter [Pseudolabrys sp.]